MSIEHFEVLPSERVRMRCEYQEINLVPSIEDLEKLTAACNSPLPDRQRILLIEEGQAIHTPHGDTLLLRDGEWPPERTQDDLIVELPASYDITEEQLLYGSAVALTRERKRIQNNNAYRRATTLFLGGLATVLTGAVVENNPVAYTGLLFFSAGALLGLQSGSSIDNAKIPDLKALASPIRIQQL